MNRLRCTRLCNSRSDLIQTNQFPVVMVEVRAGAAMVEVRVAKAATMEAAGRGGVMEVRRVVLASRNTVSCSCSGWYCTTPAQM